MERESNMGKQWFIYVLLTIAASSLGYGVSQETMHIELAHNTDKIIQVQAQLDDEIQNRKDSDAGLRQVMSDLAASQRSSMDMQRATIEQSSQLISLIKLQNQILNKPGN